MTQVIIRSAVEAEFPAIAELTVAAYRGDGQTAPGHPYEQVLRDVDDRAGDGRLLVAVDEATGDVLGSVLFLLAGSRYVEVCRAGEAEFRMLAVAPSAQGRGVGEALVRACIELAAEQGCSAVVISVRDFVLGARRLYARLGFEPVPELDWTPVPGVNLLGLRLELAASVH